MRFTVESWEPAYGTPAADGVRGAANDPSTRPVDPAVELAPEDWTVIDPAVTLDHGAALERYGSVLFVDGVRRIDARIWIDEQVGSDVSTSRPGVCASVAAGAVRCGPGRAEVEAVLVRRGLYTASDQGESVDLVRGSSNPLGNGLGRYDLRPVADDSDEAMYFGVHQHMTELELELSAEIGQGADQLVVFDGPLNDRGHDGPGGGDGAGVTVGYIKTQHVQYLPPQLHAHIGTLQVGQRTPLFAIGGRFPVWSWYLRLPTRIAHAMSGIVRLELSAGGGTDGDSRRLAIETADVVSSLLPRYASEPHKDGRAPQNLYPIAGLERHLRHLLGDSRVLERALRNATAEPVGVRT